MTGDEDTSPNPHYANEFRSHLSETRAHLVGAEQYDLEPSYFPPTGYWTVAEKDVFFYALSVYSRLRPDLIAAELPNKTVLDVSIYIDLLEAAASGHAPLARGDILAAVEVSEEWIAQEEDMASALIAAEPAWEAEAVKRRREGFVRSQLKESRIKDTAPRRDHGQQIRDDNKTQWMLEDTINALDGEQLKVMTRMVRKQDHARAERDEDVDENVGRTSTSRDRVDERGRDQCADAGGNTSTHSVGKELQHEAVDPLPVPGDVRRHATTPSPLGVPFNPPAASTSASESCPPAPSPSASGHDQTLIPLDLSPVSRRRLMKRLYMRRKRAAVTGGTVSTDIGWLKPGRKRRACTAEDEKRKTDKQGAESEEGISEKARGKRKADGVSEAEEEGQKEDLEAEVEAENMEIHQSQDMANGDDNRKDAKSGPKGGKTRPYKIQGLFEDAGLNGQTLHELGLDIFHLTNVARLINTYAALDPSLPGPPTIALATLTALRNELLVFLRSLIKRALIASEQLHAVKGRTKAWRVTAAEQVGAADVKLALEIMLGAKPSRRAQLRALARRFKEQRTREREREGRRDGGRRSAEAPDESEGMDVDGGGNAEGGNETDDEEESDDPSDDTDIQAVEFSLHQQVYAPMVRLVPRLASSSAPSSAALSDADADSDADSDALRAELDAEGALDLADAFAARRAETRLWAAIGRAPAAEAASGQAKASGNGVRGGNGVGVGAGRPGPVDKSRDTGKGRGKRVVKSAAYVDDSDSE